MITAYGSHVTHEYVTGERRLLDPARLAALLRAAGSPLELPHYSRVTVSTQNDAKSLYAIGKRPPYSVVTDEQTAGRGRLARSWTAPAGSSILLTVALPQTEDLAALPLAIGTTVLDVLRTEVPRLALKWPNDLVIDVDGRLRKLGGLITEIHEDAVLLGIGINIDMHDDELPTEQAISLRQLGVVVEREALLARLITAFAPWQRPSMASYRQVCLTIGAEVRVTLTDGTVLDGIVEEVTDAGALRVRTDDSSVEVSAGDVEHVRSR